MSRNLVRSFGVRHLDAAFGGRRKSVAAATRTPKTLRVKRLACLRSSDGLSSRAGRACGRGEGPRAPRWSPVQTEADCDDRLQDFRRELLSTCRISRPSLGETEERRRLLKGQRLLTAAHSLSSYLIGSISRPQQQRGSSLPLQDSGAPFVTSISQPQLGSLQRKRSPFLNAMVFTSFVFCLQPARRRRGWDMRSLDPLQNSCS